MNIDIFTKGTYLPHDNKEGGWAIKMATTVNGQPHSKTLSGNSKSTTHNIMHLTAVIKGLEALKSEGHDVRIYCDPYVCNIARSKSARKSNVNLWKKLDRLASKHNVTWCKMSKNQPNYNNISHIAYCKAQELVEG